MGDPRQATIRLDGGKLLRVVEECGEIEVVKERYRLRGFEGEGDNGHVSGNVDVDGPRALIRCRSCG